MISYRKENFSATISVRQFSRFVAIIDNNLDLYVCKKMGSPAQQCKSSGDGKYPNLQLPVRLSNKEVSHVIVPPSK